MKNILILLIILTSKFTFATDIISSQLITTGIVGLGEVGKIQFNIQPKTICDTYTVGYDVNYNAKSITINVLYNYNSICTVSNAIVPIISEKQLALEGVYTVNLALNVPQNPIWNQTLSLGAISVIKPFSLQCNASIPALIEPCPSGNIPVCACNGVNYQNECYAYLLAQNGNFLPGDCMSYINSNFANFECKDFSVSLPNFFENYSCGLSLYSGSELFLKYEHINTNSPSVIEFSSPTNDIQLFLVEFQNNDIKCLIKSQGNKLELKNLNSGTYYIIADRVQAGNYNVKICNPTSLAENSIKSQIKVVSYSGLIQVSFQNDKIYNLYIYDLNGKIVYSADDVKSEDLINPNLINGIYNVVLKGQNDSFYNTRVFINN
jgi:hypothetical protein